jgi:hypothetical protein
MLGLILYTVSIDLNFTVVNKKKFPTADSWSCVIFSAALLISTPFQEAQNETEKLI